MRTRHAVVFAAALCCLCAAAAADPGDSQSSHRAPAPPPPPGWDPTISPSRAVGNTHSCGSYYPELSRRMNESGDVLIGYDVGVDGALSNVHMIKSSGSDRLDLAALNCVRDVWRNTPAMKSGVAVASPNHQAIVRFSLLEELTAKDYLDRGTAAAQAGDHMLALYQFTQALFINPNYAAAYRARARVYDAIGQTDFAKGDNARADMLDKPH